MNTHDYMEQALMTESLPETELTEEQKRLTHAGLGLCTEAAELADAIKKHIFYGKDLDKVNLVEEIGDILWYSAIVLDACHSSFGEAMVKNIAKLRKRYPDGNFSAPKAIHRDVEAEREVLEDSHTHWRLGHEDGRRAARSIGGCRGAEWHADLRSYSGNIREEYINGFNLAIDQVEQEEAK
jgi:NTP pyrophosphatase (non-canonical NTP hydrolase)